MELEIPLINDLSKTFDNFNMNEHFDSEIIQMHNNFIHNKIENYTDKQIYNYIKFINLTCMDVKYYKNIANYIYVCYTKHCKIYTWSDFLEGAFIVSKRYDGYGRKTKEV